MERRQEFLLSRHFPDDVQGQFIYCCVINMNGIPRFAVYDDGAGFGGHQEPPKKPGSKA